MFLSSQGRTVSLFENRVGRLDRASFCDKRSREPTGTTSAKAGGIGKGTLQYSTRFSNSTACQWNSKCRIYSSRGRIKDGVGRNARHSVYRTIHNGMELLGCRDLERFCKGHILWGYRPICCQHQLFPGFCGPAYRREPSLRSRAGVRQSTKIVREQMTHIKKLLLPTCISPTKTSFVRTRPSSVKSNLSMYIGFRGGHKLFATNL